MLLFFSLFFGVRNTMFWEDEMKNLKIIKKYSDDNYSLQRLINDYLKEKSK